MAKFVNAATAAEMISEYTGIELYKLVDIVKEVPAADVAPVVHGRWIESGEDYFWGDYRYMCSNCEGKFWEGSRWTRITHYCPNCGAKMDEEANDDKARP